MTDLQNQKDPVILKKDSPPWDPYRAASWGFFISWAIAGIILAFNWKRLGKPNWFVPTILISILIPGLALGCTLFWISTFRTVPSMPKVFFYYIPALFMGIVFALPLTLARMQNGAYQQFKKEGPAALEKYSYHFMDAVTYGVILAIILFIVGLLGFVFIFSK
jgi:hypothetical protein